MTWIWKLTTFSVMSFVGYDYVKRREMPYEDGMLDEEPGDL
jgi:hypothetical protein